MLAAGDQPCVIYFTMLGAIIGLTAFAYAHARQAVPVVTWGPFLRGYWTGLVDCGWGLRKVAKGVGIALITFIGAMAESYAEQRSAGAAGAKH